MYIYIHVYIYIYVHVYVYIPHLKKHFNILRETHVQKNTYLVF